VQVEILPLFLLVDFGFQERVPFSPSVVFNCCHYHFVGCLVGIPGHFISIARTPNGYVKIDGFPSPNYVHLGDLSFEQDWGERQLFVFVKKKD